MLLCDFHIHTTMSDGSVDLPTVVDLFGKAGFDVIAITDHVVNGDNSLGKLARALNMSITESNFDAYLQAIRKEADRAWKEFKMLVIPGVEISKNYFKADNSGHILLLDIKEFISATYSYEKIFLEAKRQDCLIIACHPHRSAHLTNRDTLFLWNHRDKYARYIDAWEIANRDDVFGIIGLHKYPYVANSDFHKIRHLYSWKTLLNCDKTISAVKKCIRNNRGVAVTLFRN